MDQQKQIWLFPWRHRFHPWPHSVGYGCGVAMSGGVGHRCGSDPTMLWLWCRQVAVAPIVPLAWEPPYAVGTALKKKKRQRKKQRDFNGKGFTAEKLSWEQSKFYMQEDHVAIIASRILRHEACQGPAIRFHVCFLNLFHFWELAVILLKLMSGWKRTWKCLDLSSSLSSLFPFLCLKTVPSLLPEPVDLLCSCLFGWCQNTCGKALDSCLLFPHLFLQKNLHSALNYFFFSFFQVCYIPFFILFSNAPAAYGGSRARGQIQATAAGLHHSHSHVGSVLHLQPPPQLMAMPDP